MLRQEPKFSFRNLEPISYLKNFNKMVEYNTKHPLKLSPRHELKTVSLTKFPLPNFYHDMEGIFESAGRKKLDPSSHIHNSSQQQEEQFMKKHNEFMRNVLTRFINHNESRQSLYEKQKKYIRKNESMTKHARTRSQPKLKNVKHSKQLEVNPEGTGSQVANATVGSSVKLHQDPPKEKPLSVLPTLKPRRKKEKFTLRNEKNVEEYILSRKLATPISVSTARKPIPAEDGPVDFREEIINIQLKQVQKQESFADKIERQIADFEKKMDIQVHAIKYYSFWRETKQEEQKRKEEKQQGVSDRADFAIKFGNYTTR